MADKTGITWTNATWGPVTGCSKVSPACKFCYAERDWARLIHAAFAEALVSGAIDQYGRDVSGLYWTPKNLDRATAVLNEMPSTSKDFRTIPTLARSAIDRLLADHQKTMRKASGLA